MHLTIHPSQWFHHEHVVEPAEHGRWWQAFHSEGFWIFMIMVGLLAATIVLTVLYGKVPASPYPYMPIYP
jgi:hypothetical protein